MAERTPEQEAAVTAMADAKIKADAIAALQVTRTTEMDVAQTTYEAGVKAARDKFNAAVAALEG